MSDQDLAFNNLVAVDGGKIDSDKSVLKEIIINEESHLTKKLKKSNEVSKKKEKSNDIIDSTDVVNNWTDGNTETLRNWKLSLEKAKIIYEFALENLNKKLNRIKLCVILLNAIGTLIGTVTASLAVFAWANSNNINTTMTAVTTILLAIIGAINFVLGSIIKMYGLDELVQSYGIYHENLDHLCSIVSGQLVLSPGLRQDAVEFIKREYDHYLALIKQSPKISSSQHYLALKHYNAILEDNNLNFKFAQKYNTDAMIEVV